MWSKELLGTDVYHLVAAFVLYSMLGWLVESIYMSFCNRKLTNRGFGKGPFCPIYGFGAVACYLIFAPLRGHHFIIYLAGAILATIFEFVVGKGMIKFLGELWWDYNEKPFNYQGIICLESTIAWGFYALGIVYYVHGWVMSAIDRFDVNIGIRIVEFILLIVTIDYIIQLVHVFHVDVREKGHRIREKCQSIVARWI